MLPRRPITGPSMVKSWPTYLKWRDGRPRWEPGPGLRVAGHAGRDLKYPDGRWMTKGDAVTAAEVINAGIGAGAAIARDKPSERSLGALLDRLEALPKMRDAPVAAAADAPAKLNRLNKRLSRTTRANRRSHFKILRQWGGDLPVAAMKRDDFATLYDTLVEGRGVTMANRTMSTLNWALNYAVNDLEWLDKNRAARLDQVSEPGRLVLWPAEESGVFVRCADWLGMEDIGDAHILGLLTSQRRGDVLAFPELVEEDGVFRVTQRKGKRVAYVPATAPLRLRLEQMRKRKRDRFPGVSYRHELISLRTGAPFAQDGSTFTHEYRLVRAVASGLQQALDQVFPVNRQAFDYASAPFTPLPSIWDLHFQDLRDTGVTLLYEATGGDKAKVANISGHSLATIDAIIEKHYFVRNARMSRDAGSMLEDLMQRIGYAG